MSRAPCSRSRLLQYIGIFVFLCSSTIFLARYGVITVPTGPGSSALYLAIPWMIAITFWFRGWGALATYIGAWLGAGYLSGIPPVVTSVWALSDLWQVILPLLIFQYCKGDLYLRTRRDLWLFLGFAVFLNNLAGAAWGTGTLLLSGMVTGEQAAEIFTGWWVGNVVLTLLAVPVLLRYATPVLAKRHLLIEGLWR